MDMRTHYDSAEFACDWLLAPPQLATDEGLETAVIISLFTDRRANVDDVLPDNSGNRRGWWGDSFPEQAGDRIGSRLWLLHREKQLPLVRERARQYAREALQWLVDDGIARAVDVEANFPRMGVLTLDVAIARALGAPVRFRYETFWSGSNAV